MKKQRKREQQQQKQITRVKESKDLSAVKALFHGMSSVQDGIYPLDKVHKALDSVSQKFPQCCLCKVPMLA